jgi:hypothetical protein
LKDIFEKTDACQVDFIQFLTNSNTKLIIKCKIDVRNIISILNFSDDYYLLPNGRILKDAIDRYKIIFIVKKMKGEMIDDLTINKDSDVPLLFGSEGTSKLQSKINILIVLMK